jgi:hypothetical protein
MRECFELWIALAIAVVIMLCGLVGTYGSMTADSHRIDVLERRLDNLEKRELINQVEIAKIRELLWEEDTHE